MRLIDADELYGRLAFDFEMLRNGALEKLTSDDILETIHEQPTVDPVKHGRWDLIDGCEPMRWIPCKERLPEIGDTYIVTGIQKDAHEKEWHYFVDVASSHGGYIDEYWDTFNDWIEGQETHIIAWMTLPKPYKMDEVEG